jgi:hypothetical protein
MWIQNTENIVLKNIFPPAGQNLLHRRENSHNGSPCRASHGAACGVFEAVEYRKLLQSHPVPDAERVCEPDHLGLLERDGDRSPQQNEELGTKPDSQRRRTGKIYFVKCAVSNTQY